MKFKSFTALLLSSVLLTCNPTFAQNCKQQKKPSKTLYKATNFNGRFSVAKPAKLDYATKAVLFFDAFVFTGVYSLTIDEERPYFYLNLAGPASYQYEVTTKDSLHFYYADGSKYALKPSCDQLGYKGNTMAFYEIDADFLAKTKSVDLDSIIMTFTPRPKGLDAKRDKLVSSFTFRHFSEKRTAGFKALAGCFSRKLKEFE